MSTHSICICGEIRKISILLDWKKKCLINSYACTSVKEKNDIKHFVFILHLQTPSLFTSLVLKLKKSVGLLLWYVWTNPGWHWVDSRHWAGPLVSALVSVVVLFFFFFVNAISLDHDVIGTSRSVGYAWKLFLVLVTLKVKIICCFCLFCFVFDKKKATTKKKL